MVAHISVAVFDQQNVTEFVIIGVSVTGKASSGKKCESVYVFGHLGMAKTLKM